jgi:hypothetical protein
MVFGSGGQLSPMQKRTEFKAGTRRPPEVDYTDRKKSEAMTDAPFRYTAGVWLRGPNGRLYMATFRDGQQCGRIWEMPLCSF